MKYILTFILLAGLSLESQAGQPQQKCPPLFKRHSFEIGFTSVFTAKYKVYNTQRIWVPQRVAYSFFLTERAFLQASYQHLYIDGATKTLPRDRFDLLGFEYQNASLNFGYRYPIAQTGLGIKALAGLSYRKGYETQFERVYSHWTTNDRIHGETVQIKDAGINAGLGLDYRVCQHFSIGLLSEFQGYVSLTPESQKTENGQHYQSSRSMFWNSLTLAYRF